MALFRSDFQGTIYGVETFQHGMSWSSTDSAAGLASDLATAWLAVLADAGFNAAFRTDVVWSLVNVSELGAAPSQPITVSAQATINDGGTSTSPGLPPQCAPCLSIRTATAGSRARGRSYLPPTHVDTVGASGRLSSTVRTDITDALDAFFTTMAGNAADLVVISAVGGVWTSRPAVSVALGDVLDTQRSRRADIAEVYTVISV